MKRPKSLPRFFALWLSLSLALPSPAWALRPASPTQTGVEEQLAAALGRPTAAGAEETRQPITNPAALKYPTVIREKATGDRYEVVAVGKDDMQIQKTTEPPNARYVGGLVKKTFKEIVEDFENVVSAGAEEPVNLMAVDFSKESENRQVRDSGVWAFPVPKAGLFIPAEIFTRPGELDLYFGRPAQDGTNQLVNPLPGRLSWDGNGNFTLLREGQEVSKFTQSGTFGRDPKTKGNVSKNQLDFQFQPASGLLVRENEIATNKGMSFAALRDVRELQRALPPEAAAKTWVAAAPAPVSSSDTAVGVQAGTPGMPPGDERLALLLPGLELVIEDPKQGLEKRVEALRRLRTQVRRHEAVRTLINVLYNPTLSREPELRKELLLTLALLIPETIEEVRLISRALETFSLENGEPDPGVRETAAVLFAAARGVYASAAVLWDMTLLPAARDSALSSLRGAVLLVESRSKGALKGSDFEWAFWQALRLETDLGQSIRLIQSFLQQGMKDTSRIPLIESLRDGRFAESGRWRAAARQLINQLKQEPTVQQAGAEELLDDVRSLGLRVVRQALKLETPLNVLDVTGRVGTGQEYEGLPGPVITLEAAERYLVTHPSAYVQASPDPAGTTLILYPEARFTRQQAMDNLDFLQRKLEQVTDKAAKATPLETKTGLSYRELADSLAQIRPGFVLFNAPGQEPQAAPGWLDKGFDYSKFLQQQLRKVLGRADSVLNLNDYEFDLSYYRGPGWVPLGLELRVDLEAGMYAVEIGMYPVNLDAAGAEEEVRKALQTIAQQRGITRPDIDQIMRGTAVELRNLLRFGREQYRQRENAVRINQRNPAWVSEPAMINLFVSRTGEAFFSDGTPVYYPPNLERVQLAMDPWTGIIDILPLAEADWQIQARSGPPIFVPLEMVGALIEWDQLEKTERIKRITGWKAGAEETGSFVARHDTLYRIMDAIRNGWDAAPGTEGPAYRQIAVAAVNREKPALEQAGVDMAEMRRLIDLMIPPGATLPDPFLAFFAPEVVDSFNPDELIEGDRQGLLEVLRAAFNLKRMSEGNVSFQSAKAEEFLDQVARVLRYDFANAGMPVVGTPNAARAALQDFVQSVRGTIEALSPWDPKQPVTDLAETFPRLVEAAKQAGYEKGIAQAVWTAQLPAGPLLKSRNVYIQEGVSWNKNGEMEKQLAGYVTFVELPELADVVIGDDLNEVPITRYQAFLQVNDGTARAVTPGLLKYLEEWGLLDPGAVVVLDLLLQRQGDQGEDLLLFA